MAEENIMSVAYNKKPCYDIRFEKDFSALEDSLNSLGCAGRKIAVITDSNVEKLYLAEVMDIARKVSDTVISFTIPAGEANKNLTQIEKIYETLIKNRFDRHDFLLALGGGVVGDMCGYAAATYLRGVSFVQIPTTLLSQTDSSVGGKTGVDFNGYKNMIGAFYMPRLVYMNISTLNSLDDRQFASGFAEVMKHGLIKDQSFYTWLIENMYEIQERDVDTLLYMVQKSCDIKRRVVEKDPTEQGDRALLNYGHTLGHAIEKAKDFSLTHGECVALGSIAAAFISWKKQLISMEEFYEIRDMFVPFDLPISIDDLDKEQVLDNVYSDKKADGNSIRFILLKSIGKAFIDKTVTKKEMEDALDELIYIENND